MSDLCNKVICFLIDEVPHGLPLNCVIRVNLAVEITPLPNKHDQLVGVINFQGKIVPVVDLRSIFNLPKKKLEIADYLIIFQTDDHKLMAFIADKILGVSNINVNDIQIDKRVQTTEYTLLTQQQGLMFIHNPDQINVEWDEHHG